MSFRKGPSEMMEKLIFRFKRPSRRAETESKQREHGATKISRLLDEK